MPYTPVIKDYKPFYIQAPGDTYAWDTRDYGLVAQSQPNPDDYEVKEPFKNEWFDEHGDDEYLGRVASGTWVSAVKLKAREVTVNFFIKTFQSAGVPAIVGLNTLRNSFRNKIVYRPFSVFDSWNQRGYKNVRFVKDEVVQQDITDEEAWMIFSVTFKINDPTNRGYLSEYNDHYVIE